MEKTPIKGFAKKKSESKDEVKYECKFTVPQEFGEIGAILVENEHHKEMHFMDIALDNGLTVNCNSWVAPNSDNPNKRIFFTDKVSHLLLEQTQNLVIIYAYRSLFMHWGILS